MKRDQIKITGELLWWTRMRRENQTSLENRVLWPACALRCVALRCVALRRIASRRIGSRRFARPTRRDFPAWRFCEELSRQFRAPGSRFRYDTQLIALSFFMPRNIGSSRVASFACRFALQNDCGNIYQFEPCSFENLSRCNLFQNYFSI